MSNKWIIIQMHPFTYIFNHMCFENSENLEKICLAHAHMLTFTLQSFFSFIALLIFEKSFVADPFKCSVLYSLNKTLGLKYSGTPR